MSETPPPKWFTTALYLVVIAFVTACCGLFVAGVLKWLFG